jgi:DNA-binding beta-propeller fold protein YncE
MRFNPRFSLFVLGSSITWIACDHSAAPEPRTEAPAPAITAAQEAALAPRPLLEGTLLPTGARITPQATPGVLFHTLNPDLPMQPDFVVDHAVTTALSPNGKLLLVLTSGYNAITTPDDSGSFVPDLSNEYVFIYDVTNARPVKRQVLQIPNTFVGMAWNPSGDEFYVSGGVNDDLHVFRRTGSSFAELTPAIPLGHSAGLGLAVPPTAAGVGVDGAGKRVVVANYENDSVSIVDLATRAVSELDLRPGKIDATKSGQPGGEYPYWIEVKGNKAYISSQRDRELVVVRLGAAPAVAARIPIVGQPNRMIFNKAQDHLYVAVDNSDTVAVVDTNADKLMGTFGVAATRLALPGSSLPKGANPNSLALSPDEKTLYVTDGGTNAVAVVSVFGFSGQVIGLIPTGWCTHDGGVRSIPKELDLQCLGARSSAHVSASASPGGGEPSQTAQPENG